MRTDKGLLSFSCLAMPRAPIAMNGVIDKRELLGGNKNSKVQVVLACTLGSAHSELTKNTQFQTSDTFITWHQWNPACITATT